MTTIHEINDTEPRTDDRQFVPSNPLTGDSPFSDADVIYAYTRKDAIEDGFQVDANEGDFAEVTRQHYKMPVYMTRRVFDVIEKAVNNKRHFNDFKGVWHDILWMSRVYCRQIAEDRKIFQVKIVGAARRQIFTLIAEVTAKDIDDPQPALTIRFPDED